MMNNMLKRHM